MIAISNASPLIALGRICRADLFQKIFGKIIIPESVHREVVANCPDPKQKRYLEDANRDFIVVMRPRRHHVFSRNLGDGEREVLDLAIEMSPDIVLLDDKKARNEAKELGYLPSFTTDVIKEAEYRGLIPSYRKIISELWEQEIYLPED